MDATPTPPTSDLPADMVTAVAADAARDADNVGLFLRELGLSASPERPLRLPAFFLLRLAAALRLLLWEAQGFLFHRADGLPSAHQAIRDAFLAPDGTDADSAGLCVAVLRLSLERFAWNGPRDLNADIALDDLTDEAALDVLAEFLWANRHVATTTEDRRP